MADDFASGGSKIVGREGCSAGRSAATFRDEGR